MPTGRSVNVTVSPDLTVNLCSASSNDFLSTCRYLPSLFFTVNLNSPFTTALLLSVAVFFTVSVPTSLVNLFTRATVESSVVVFDTVPSPLVVLPVEVNV